MTQPADNGLPFLHSARPALAHARVAAVLESAWGISGEIEDAGGDRDQNLAVTAADGTRCLVKVGQPGEHAAVLAMQLAALAHARRRDPGLPLPDVIPTRAGHCMHTLPAAGSGEHRLRVFSWLPGRPVRGRARPASLLRAIGDTLARLDLALRDFFHPGAGHRLLWDLRQAPAVRACAADIDDASTRTRVLRVLDECADTLLPRLDGLRCQVIHGDATVDNVLVDASAGISGLIDFGDAVHAPLAQELAVAMADIPYGLAEPWGAACQLAAGFDQRIRLEDDEAALLWDLARARLALTAAVLAARATHRPGGVGSMGTAVDACRRQLEALEALGRDAALRELRRVLRLPESVAVSGDSAVAGARERLLVERDRRLLPGLALFYPEEPLHAVRGQGMWLIDADGRRYLDCYNNVPHVGHCHPHVVNAVARQTAALTTNVRYLYANVTEYAERLARLLPGELGVAVFVNSGSEANDLAWRMARASTGNRGALVTAGAYHGATEATAALSPCDAAGAGSGGHVRTFRPPAAAGTAPPGGAPGAAPRPAADVARGLDELDAAGLGVAALLVDPAFVSDGLPRPPDGYLADVFARVRAAGGLCIADEVQAGFGRLGTRWGFEAHAVVPDIVTLGKPAANGYPLGAVITTPAIMAAFADRHEYFSTFGGNPVACAAGLAVLDVIDRDGLCGHAARTGRHLRARLDALMQRHAAIGDVRGRGLLLGVEMVRADDPRAPAPDMAAAVTLAMRRDGVLIGIEGPRANVLKIRPPLVCSTGHADRLVDALDRALRSVA